MTYKVGDLVYFEDEDQNGVGKIVEINPDNWAKSTAYLVNSSQIEGGHNGERPQYRHKWWLQEEHLKPFFKKVGQKYKVIGNVDEDAEISIGDIITLISIENDNLSYYESENVPSFPMYDLDHPKCEVEFYEDVEDAEEQKENEMFTKEDLKVGYLVKVRKGGLAHVVNTTQKGMCLNYEEGRDTFNIFNNDLTSKWLSGYDIIEVYGLTETGYNAHKFEVGDRKLLWKREEVKEMTIEDIQKVLGYKIKVVE